MKSWILAAILAVVAIAPIFYLVYNMKLAPETRRSPEAVTVVEFDRVIKNYALEPGAVFDVLACKVVDGYKFGLYLEGEKWIEAHLAVATSEEAIPFVIELLNNAELPPPSVTLLRQVGDYWIVEFELTQNGKRVSLVDVLRSKELLLR